MKDDILSVRTAAPKKARLEKIATITERTMSQLVNMCIDACIDQLETEAKAANDARKKFEKAVRIMPR
jgi:predicted DNA-binding protein